MGWGRECACFFSLFFVSPPVPFLSFLSSAVLRFMGLGDGPLRIDLNFACRPTPSLRFCNPKPKMTLKLTRDSLAANSRSHRHSPTRPCTTANNSSCSSCTPAKRRTHTHTHTAASNRARRTRTAHRRLRGPTRGATTTTRGSTTTAARRTLVRAGPGARTTPCAAGMPTRTRTRPRWERSMRRAGSCAMRTARRAGTGTGRERGTGGAAGARVGARRIAGVLTRCCWRLRRTAGAAVVVR